MTSSDVMTPGQGGLTRLKSCSRFLKSRMKWSSWVLALDRVTRRCNSSSTWSYRDDTSSTAVRCSSDTPSPPSSLRSSDREAPPSRCSWTNRTSSRMLPITALYLESSRSASCREETSFKTGQTEPVFVSEATVSGLLPVCQQVQVRSAGCWCFSAAAGSHPYTAGSADWLSGGKNTRYITAAVWRLLDTKTAAGLQ